MGVDLSYRSRRVAGLFCRSHSQDPYDHSRMVGALFYRNRKAEDLSYHSHREEDLSYRSLNSLVEALSCHSHSRTSKEVDACNTDHHMDPYDSERIKADSLGLMS
jgi:hypothetical protein